MLIVNSSDDDDDGFKDLWRVQWHSIEGLAMLSPSSVKAICRSFDYREECWHVALHRVASPPSHHHLFVSAADAVEAEEILMTMNFY